MNVKYSKFFNFTILLFFECFLKILNNNCNNNYCNNNNNNNCKNMVTEVLYIVLA